MYVQPPSTPRKRIGLLDGFKMSAFLFFDLFEADEDSDTYRNYA